MENKKVVKKVAEVLVNLGDIQAGQYSTLLGFYEPKIPKKIMKKGK